MAGRTSINDVTSAGQPAAGNHHPTASLHATSAGPPAGAISTASLTTATTTVSAIRDVSTASGRPSRRDQLTNNQSNHPVAAHTTATTASSAGRPGPPGSIRASAQHHGGAGAGGVGGPPNSRSYAGSPTGQYPAGPVDLGRGNVPQSISTSAFTVGTSRYNTRYS